MRKSEGERRGWLLIVVLLLIGLLCVIVTGNLAIRFAPRWTLQADMRSRLDPESAYFAPQPGYALQPLDPAILTPPVWIKVFLTPGQPIPTRVPQTAIVFTKTSAPTQILSTNPPSSTPTVTGTPALFTPTKFSTLHPSQTKTATATLSRMSTATGAAASTGTAMPTAAWTMTGTSTSTATPTGTFTATSSPTATASPTNTPRPEADLRITIDDNAVSYDDNASVQYTIVVSNPAGPAAAIGAAVTSSLSANLVNISWSCAGAAGASCTGSGAGNIADTVNLPSGTSLTYRVSASVISSPAGDLVSTVVVNPPAGITDPVPGNNQAADIDQLVVSSPLPYGNIDPVKNGSIEYIPTNSTTTLQFASPLHVGAHAGYDLVYYELPQGSDPGIWMDCVTLQLGDGRNWYTILNWGDNSVDTNASMNMATVGASEETDNLVVGAPFMYDLTGVALELDGVVPDGDYKYIRIIAPPAPQDGPSPGSPDGVEVDAIYIMP